MHSGGNPLVILLLLWTVLTVSTSPAQSAGDQRHITVRQAAARAQAQDPQLQQLQNTLVRLCGRMSPRIRAHLPVMFLEYSGSETYDWSSPYRLSHTLGGGFELTLTDGGESWYRMRELRREVQHTELQLRQRKQEILLETVQLCTDILYRRAAAELLTEELQLYHRLSRSAEQQQESGTISLQDYRRIRIEAEEKSLDLQAEQLQLQQLGSQLTMKLGYPDPPRPHLTGTFPRHSPATAENPIQPESEYFRSRAVHHAVRVIDSRINCERAADQRSLQLRRLCPKITVTSRIDFSGPTFPPASPALSFGISLSTGPGRLSVATKDSTNRSAYSFSRTPSARLAVDLSQSAATSRRRAVENLEYARRELQHSTNLAALQAQQLAQEAGHLAELAQHQRESWELHRRELKIHRQKFEYGTTGFEQLVESRQQYTASRLTFYRLNQRYLLTACKLLQLGALPERIFTLLDQFNTAERGRLDEET
jgi:outer membrane protein TolC